MRRKWVLTTLAAPAAAEAAGTEDGAALTARRRRGRRLQHLAALSANLTALCAGMAMGWTSPALPLLQMDTNATSNATEGFNITLEDSTNATSPSPASLDLDQSLGLSLTKEQGSWVSSLLPLGAVAGALPIGLLSDRFGRKRMLLSLALPYILGWSHIAFANDMVWMVYLGRFLTGMATGATTALVPHYCEEIAEVAIRGALGVYLGLMVCLGIMWIYVLGAYVPYFWFTTSGSVWPVVFIVIFIWMPESPVFLASKGRYEQAKKALEWLRGGQDCDTQIELDNMVASFKEAPPISTKQSLSILFFTNPVRSKTCRAVAIVLSLMLFQQLSGIYPVLFYSKEIFKRAGSSFSGETSIIIIAVVQVIAVLCSTFTVDRLGRRFLLLMSSVIMAFCHLSLSLYSIFCKQPDPEMASFVLWIPLVTLMLYIIVFAVGFGPLPWLMMAELLPEHSKGWAGAASAAFHWSTAQILTKQFPLMLKNVGQDITYGALSFFCVLGAIFVAVCVPETKGKTKAEIEQSLGGDKP